MTDLRTAMDKLAPPIKYNQADTIEVFCQKIGEGMRAREAAPSSEGERSKQDCDSEGGGAKRVAHEEHADSGSQKRSKHEVEGEGETSKEDRDSGGGGAKRAV